MFAFRSSWSFMEALPTHISVALGAASAIAAFVALVIRSRSGAGSDWGQA